MRLMAVVADGQVRYSRVGLGMPAERGRRFDHGRPAERAAHGDPGHVASGPAQLPRHDDEIGGGDGRARRRRAHEVVVVVMGSSLKVPVSL